MHLTNLFNIKFLKENIKKSNGVLLFLLLIGPMLNILLMFNYLNQGNYIVDFFKFNIINFIGALIIPVIIAYSLNKYLFKQNSVDFYLSKPISRCKLYFTNLLGGFFLILILILLNSIIYILFGIFTDMLIPFSFILDYFIYFLTLYYFIFTITTLSISLSGNFITALIVSLIITWTPFFVSYSNKFLYDNYNNTYIKVSSCNLDTEFCIKQGNTYAYKINSYKEITSMLSLPTSYILKNEFNNRDLIKTIILSILYIGLGYKVFQKRKMENNTIGFISEKIHYLVKTLTIIPFALLTTLFIYEKDILTGTLIIIITFILSIIYDLLTRKNNYNIVKSIIIFVWSFVILYFVNVGLINYYNKESILDVKTITYKNIYTDDITYEISNFDFISRQEETSNIVSEIFYTKDGSKKLIILTTEGEYDKLHQNDLDDYQKYINKYNFNQVNGAYFNYKRLDISKLNFNNINNTTSEDDMFIEVYSYKKHKFEKVNLPINASKDILEYITSFLNENYLKNQDKTINRMYISNSELANDENYNILKFIIEKYPNDMKNYLIKHYNDKVQDSYIVLGYGFTTSFDKIENYIIHDVKSFENFINSYKELCYNDGSSQKDDA